MTCFFAAVMLAYHNRLPSGTIALRRRFEGMPHYYFHLTGACENPDAEGVDLPDDHAAWEEAVQACTDPLQDLLFEDFEPGQEFGMDVVRQDGRPVFRLRFATDAAADPARRGEPHNDVAGRALPPQ